MARACVFLIVDEYKNVNGTKLKRFELPVSLIAASLLGLHKATLSRVQGAHSKGLHAQGVQKGGAADDG